MTLVNPNKSPRLDAESLAAAPSAPTLPTFDLQALALRLPAAALVVAATGFGCVYAYGQGAQTGIALACLS